MKIYIAKVMVDNDECVYEIVHEKAYLTELDAKEAIKNIFGHVKTVKSMELVK